MTDKRLILNPDFLLALGGFHGAWSSLEVLVSYSIGHALKIPFNETHMLTSGMEFGRKATLLRNLVHRSDRKNKAQIIGLIGRLQNESLRNVFAHGMITSSRDTVTFIGPITARGLSNHKARFHTQAVHGACSGGRRNCREFAGRPRCAAA
jgi:hypothetical protein